MACPTTLWCNSVPVAGTVLLFPHHIHKWKGFRHFSLMAFELLIPSGPRNPRRAGVNACLFEARFICVHDASTVLESTSRPNLARVPMPSIGEESQPKTTANELLGSGVWTLLWGGH